MKIFFRIPELFLIVAMLLAPVIVANTALGIQLHDTYYVFGYNWSLNTFFIPVIILLTLTWLCHVLCRKYNSLPVIGRWIQVAVTLICLAIVVSILSSSLIKRSGFDAYNEPAWEKYTGLTHVLHWTLILFILTQLLFWITAIIATILKVRSKNPLV